jgi:predicted tellurium resistance membrane protein TerC
LSDTDARVKIGREDRTPECERLLDPLRKGCYFLTNLIDLALDPAAWVALATLIAMEIVLGVDNLIFVALLTSRVPESRRQLVTTIGLGVALFFRLLLLGSLALLVELTRPLFSVFEHGFSWRDLVMAGGGLFLVWKATREIHEHVEARHDAAERAPAPVRSAFSAIVQVIALDLVFSIDSIVTAVGMTDHIPIMAIAVIVAMVLMLVAAAPLSRFIVANPTLVMLALSFLLMIGMVLIADGFGVHVPKGYIYAAVIFSGAVEALNMRRRGRGKR